MKKFLIIFVLSIFTIGVDYFLITNNLKHYEREKNLLTQSLVNQAKTLFDIMMITRKWNAEHEAVYVKNSSIEANSYLLNNFVKTQNGDTLIKINSAWMTRQISQLANANGNYFYKITSLNPINPENNPDDFEIQALEYFQKNKDEKYYYKLPDFASEQKAFHFMGSLKVQKGCIKCHSESANNIGDIRGGIRVSIPSEIYKNTYKNITTNKTSNIQVIIIFSFISFVIIVLLSLFLIQNQEKIKKLNLSLRKKVNKRTKELYTLNKELESRVEDAVEEVKNKEKLMISQAKSAAMGEMLSMIAHQWRQPLSEITMINNNILAEILFSDNDSAVMKKNIELSFDIVDHLSQTIDDFTNFFKPTKQKEIFLLVDAVNNVTQMLENILKQNHINLRVNIDNKLKLYTYKRELTHVFLNIINNSKDAFLEQNIEDRFIAIDVAEDENFLNIKICDNAGGISQENIKQVFQPYFSTKSKNGTGLGLYISKVIIENHIEGKISVTNCDGGVCFLIKINLDSEAIQ